MKRPHDAREMTKTEILDTIKLFGEAYMEAIQAGDLTALRFMVANHYLIQQFVSPYYNRRNDEWGTDRFKFPLVVIDEVRTVKSHDLENFIVGYRFHLKSLKMVV